MLIQVPFSSGKISSIMYPEFSYGADLSVKIGKFASSRRH